MPKPDKCLEALFSHEMRKIQNDCHIQPIYNQNTPLIIKLKDSVLVGQRSNDPVVISIGTDSILHDPVQISTRESVRIAYGLKIEYVKLKIDSPK